MNLECVVGGAMVLRAEGSPAELAGFVPELARNLIREARALGIDIARALASWSPAARPGNTVDARAEELLESRRSKDAARKRVAYVPRPRSGRASSAEVPPQFSTEISMEKSIDRSIDHSEVLGSSNDRSIDHRGVAEDLRGEARETSAEISAEKTSAEGDTETPGAAVLLEEPVPADVRTVVARCAPAVEAGLPPLTKYDELAIANTIARGGDPAWLHWWDVLIGQIVAIPWLHGKAPPQKNGKVNNPPLSYLLRYARSIVEGGYVPKDRPWSDAPSSSARGYRPPAKEPETEEDRNARLERMAEESLRLERLAQERYGARREA